MSDTNLSNITTAKKVFKIVLTGGPCGGKTTAQERLTTFFERLGYKIYRCPEVASILFKSGLRIEDIVAASETLAFQEHLLTVLISVENTLVEMAEKLGKKAIILYDRGAMDGAAYVTEEVWNKILERKNLDSVEINNRYDQIIFLESAARHAEKYYVKNVTRTEDLDRAKLIDEKTRRVWIGHPHLHIISNASCRSFEDKIKKLIQVVADQIGVNIGDRLAPLSVKRKYFVDSIKQNISFPHYQEFDIVHYVLKSKPDVHIRVTKRGRNGHWVYTHTQHRVKESVETRMQINKRQFEAFLKHTDPKFKEINIKLRCFVADEQYYELNYFQQPHENKSLMILETYTTKKTEDIQLPNFLNINREITQDKKFSLYHISKTTDSLSVR